MEFLAEIVFEIVGEVVVALGLEALCKIPGVAADLKTDTVQTLFNRHPLDCGRERMAGVESVRLLWFEQGRADGEDPELLIGVYRTEESAKAAMSELRINPDFATTRRLNRTRIRSRQGLLDSGLCSGLSWVS